MSRIKSIGQIYIPNYEETLKYTNTSPSPVYEADKLLDNEEELTKRIKARDLKDLWKDEPLKLAFEILSLRASSKLQKTASEAKKLLKKLRLEGFVKDKTRKKIKSLYLVLWENSPASLIVLVNQTYSFLREALKIKKNKVIAYQQTYKKIFGRKISKKELKWVINNRHKDPLKKSIALIAHRFEASYDGLYKLYTRVRKRMTYEEALTFQTAFEKAFNGEPADFAELIGRSIIENP